MEETNATNSISDDSGVETSSNDSTKLTRKLNYNVVIESEENVVLSTENTIHEEDYKSKDKVKEILNNIEESFSITVKSSQYKKRDEICSNTRFLVKKDDTKKHLSTFTRYHMENRGIDERKHRGEELLKIEEEADIFTRKTLDNGSNDNLKEPIETLSIAIGRTENLVDNGINILDGGPLLQTGEIVQGKDCSYKILRLIGEGNCSEVYSAEVSYSREPVAIKVFRRGRQYSLTADKEYHILEKLSQQPIHSAISLLDACMFKDLSCFVFEQLDLNIRQLIMKNRRRGLPIWSVQKFAKDILMFLQHFHKLGFVHGDLKPGNIMWSGQHGAFKCFDFGLSFQYLEAFEDESADFNAHMPRVVHSLGYRAPEVIAIEKQKTNGISRSQLRHSGFTSEPVLGPSCDIWAFGCLLLECIAGRKLFRTGEIIQKENSLDKHIDKLISETKQKEYLEERTNTNNLESFKDLIHKCLTVDVNERISASDALKHAAITSDVPVCKEDNILLISPIIKFVLDENIEPDTVLNKCAMFGKIKEIKTKEEILTLYVLYVQVKDAVKARNQFCCPNIARRMSDFDENIIIMDKASRKDVEAIDVDSNKGIVTEFYPLQLWDSL